jgi:hypothetical protein
MPMGHRQSSEQVSSFTVDEFCARNRLSLPKYHKLKNEGRGPAEMRLGLQMVRISAAAEVEWQQRMSDPSGPEAERRREMEARAKARGKHAGVAAALSLLHVSNVKRKERARRRPAKRGDGA